MSVSTVVAARPENKAAKGSPIRVMIVDDSAVVRGLVARWIDAEPGLEIAARYANGKLAADNAATVAPDVIILDIEMPVMDGITALPLLRRNCPRARIIMASTLSTRNAEISLKALSLGATDYIPKPDSNSGITTSASFRRELLAKVKVLGARRQTGAVRTIRSTGTTGASALPPAGRSRPAVAEAPANGGIKLRAFSRQTPRILTIGSSTGGPQALLDLFKAIAGDIGRVPVVLTQHMPVTFTTILARNIGLAAGCPAREGVEGEVIRPGHIYVAPGGRHMSLAGPAASPRIRLDNGPEINFCRPSVEPLFKSVAKLYGPAALAVVLTGMGQDGAEGALGLAEAGGSVIAQDEATSVVWGMPKAAAEAGACSAVLPLDRIGPKISLLLTGGRR